MKGWIVDGLMFERLNCDDMNSCWISGECIIEVWNFEFNFEWVEGYNKVYWKNSYLSDLNAFLNDLKLIGNIFQRSTTSPLMTSSNSIDFEDELRFEVG